MCSDKFNRSLEPNGSCVQATRSYNPSDAEPIEKRTGAGLSLDLLEPRPLAPPGSRYVVTDRIEISMLQFGFQTSNTGQASRNQEARFSSTNVSSQQSRATGQGSLASNMWWSHLNSLQSFNSGTNTIDHPHPEVVIHASTLPPQRNNSQNITGVTPEISSPSHLVNIHDHHMRSESTPPGERSGGSPDGHDHGRLFKKPASFSSFSSSHSVSSSETRTISYHSQSDEHWMEKYQELLAFYRIHNHSNVPSIFPENQALANWVKRTRVQYKLLHQTSQNWPRSTLTRERAELLSGVDFQVNLRSLSWQQHYEKLVSYHKKHGHVRVSIREDPSLCNWIKRQRKHCREFFNGEGSMTAEQIQKLILFDLL